MEKIICLTLVIAALAGCFGFQEDGNQAPVTGEAVPVAFFEFSHRGSSAFDIYWYTVETDEATGEATVIYELNCGNETYTLPADDELMQQLAVLVNVHGIRAWDGFDESNPMVLDGYGFGLQVRLQDGTGISAWGSNSYPKGYSDASAAIDELFRGYLKKHGIEPEGWF